MALAGKSPDQQVAVMVVSIDGSPVLTQRTTGVPEGKCGKIAHFNSREINGVAMTTVERVLWCALAVGMAFGVVGQLTGFCLNRALRDYHVYRSDSKLRSFLLAMGVAVLGTQSVSMLGLVDLQKSIYLVPSISWLLLPIGAVAFGYGMILANGCGARALVMLGQGNLRSLWVLLCMGISAFITLTGVIAPLRMTIASATPLTNGSLASLSPSTRLWVTAAVGLLLLGFAFWRGRLFHSKRDLAGGLLVGLLIVAGWLTTGWLGDDEFDPVPVVSLTFVAPVGETIQYAMISTGLSLRFGIVAVLGVYCGSLVISLLRRQFHLHGFTAAGDMLRYMAGGVLMGVGGALASGCSIGQGLTGMSTLSAGSFIATVGIFSGGWLALTLTTPSMAAEPDGGAAAAAKPTAATSCG